MESSHVLFLMRKKSFLATQSEAVATTVIKLRILIIDASSEWSSRIRDGLTMGW